MLPMKTSASLTTIHTQWLCWTGEENFGSNMTAPANRLKLFSPGDLVTNPYGRSNVTDVDNDCLHVLNRDGKYLRCVDYG